MIDISTDFDSRGNSSASQLHDAAERHLLRGDRQQALALFRASIALCPHYKSLELLGECLISLGRPIESIPPLAAATALHSQPRAPALLASAFLALGQVDDARRFASLALERNPQYGYARELLEAVDQHTST